MIPPGLESEVRTLEMGPLMEPVVSIKKYTSATRMSVAKSSVSRSGSGGAM